MRIVVRRICFLLFAHLSPLSIHNLLRNYKDYVIEKQKFTHRYKKKIIGKNYHRQLWRSILFHHTFRTKHLVAKWYSGMYNTTNGHQK